MSIADATVELARDLADARDHIRELEAKLEAALMVCARYGALLVENALLEAQAERALASAGMATDGDDDE